MKNIKLFMCLAFIAFTFSAQAQPNAVQNRQDTVQIRLQGRNQVFITGKTLKNLTEYQRADSLKSLFFADLKKSQNAETFPETPKRIHYLINLQGKRRLKAEINEDAATKFDLQYEKTRMKLDLPPLHYTVYDLPKNVEMHFFLEDTLAFKLVDNTDLTKALQEMNKDKKKLRGLTIYRIKQVGFGFENNNPKKSKILTVEWNPGIGAMLLGSQPSPVLSYDLFMTIPSTRFSDHRIGASFNAFILTDFSDGKFSQMNTGINLNGYYQFKLNLNKSYSWFGITAGILSTDFDTGLKANAFKWGLMATQGQNIFVIDLIKIGKRKSLPMFTYKRTIF